MSHTVHIPSRRRLRRTAPAWVVRTGVAGGVLSTLAASGAPATARAAGASAETRELPAVTAEAAAVAARSAEATRLAAHDHAQRAELQEQQDRAAAAAHRVAKKRKAEQEAERRAEAERKAQAARPRAARTAARTAQGTPATGRVAALLGFLQAQVGKAYVLGASGPSAYDCSGLTQAAFRTIGVELPRVSQDQSATGTPVSLDALRPGDILSWGGRGSAYHVAVYVGGGMYIDAANPGKGVVEQRLSDWPPTGATRVL